MTEDEARPVSEILADSEQLYRDKNDDYGDSWRLIGKTLAVWLDHQGEDELKIPADPAYLNSFGLFTRRLDKMIRLFNGTFLADEMKVDESIAETAQDDVNYAAMHTHVTERLAGASEDDGKLTPEDPEWYLEVLSRGDILWMNGRHNIVEEVSFEFDSAHATEDSPRITLRFRESTDVYGFAEELAAAIDGRTNTTDAIDDYGVMPRE